MIKVLFVARYRDETMNRKVELLAANPDITVWQICPRHWRDEFVQTEQAPVESGRLRRVVVPLVGRVGDPHRVLYRTLFFGMNRFRPDIVHAEEEPAWRHCRSPWRADSRRQSRLVLTVQNVDREALYVEWVRRRRCARATRCCARIGRRGTPAASAYEKTWRFLPASGVDTPCFRQVRAMERCEQNSSTWRSGALPQEKGIDLLIAALSRLIALLPRNN